jgi:hypothetical protein
MCSFSRDLDINVFMLDKRTVLDNRTTLSDYVCSDYILNVLEKIFVLKLYSHICRCPVD